MMKFYLLNEALCGCRHTKAVSNNDSLVKFIIMLDNSRRRLHTARN